MNAPGHPAFVPSWLRRLLRNHRRRAWALLCFFLLFLVVSTAALVHLQRAVNGPPPFDRMAASQDLHTLVSGSLALSGLHSDDILREETVLNGDGSGGWNSYFTEVLVAREFPLRGWIDGLRASLDRAGARLVTREEPEGLTVEILAVFRDTAEEVTVEKLLVRVRPTPDAVPALATNRPRASLVIDDLGQNPAHFSRLVRLGIPLTVSILPQLPFSLRTAREAADLDLEILLHQPMEPYDFPEKRPGPGAILAEMTEEEIRRQIEDNLESVPGVKGVNNHMGSRLTTDFRAMKVLMEELRERGLFFLDSRTSPRSLAFDTALGNMIPAAQRDIFLDAYDDEEFIRSQVRKLIELARTNGRAIGIGHPYKNTLAVLEEMKDEILASEIDWVPITELLVRKTQASPARISSLQEDLEEGKD